jgi:hypothetical protein
LLSAHSATATEHLGEVETALVETLPNGTAAITAIQDPTNATDTAAGTYVGMLSYVMILSNLPRSFLELRLLLENVAEPIESIMAAWEEVAPPPPTHIVIAAPTLRRSLLHRFGTDNVIQDEHPPESQTQAHSHLSMLSRQLQQSNTSATSAFVPVYGVVSATAAPVATCGNGVCEYGEAVGTWAYTESWHCPQDCPFELHACPQQVCSMPL